MPLRFLTRCLFSRPLRYCVLLITEEDEAFVPVNDAFFDFASSNTKEVLRFAYVYQRQQQPLCETLLKKQDVNPPQVRVQHRPPRLATYIFS